MKSEKFFIWGLIGGVILWRLLRKPLTRVAYGAYTGPKFYAALRETIVRNDGREIAELKRNYEAWPGDVKSLFNDNLRKLNLKRPW